MQPRFAHVKIYNLVNYLQGPWVLFQTVIQYILSLMLFYEPMTFPMARNNNIILYYKR